MPAHLLVVEDNADNLNLMVYLLKAHGYTPVVAGDGEEAIQAVLREAPDLIVCDVQLPKLDGYGVARRLKSDPNLRAIPLVAVTALAMVGDRDKLLAAGLDGYISKPIDPKTFVRQLEAYLPADRVSSFRVQTPSQPTASPVSASPCFCGTILVVDDTPANINLARHLFGSLGYQTIAARSVAEAVKLLREVRPDLIVSDVHMPDRSGWDFIRTVKADPALRSIPFLFLSSTCRHEKDKDHARALGATGILFRPIEPQALLNVVSSCLAKQSPDAEQPEPELPESL